MTPTELVDKYIPHRGPCLICGEPGMGARHRTIDTIRDLMRGGDSVEAIARDYSFPVEVVRAVSDASPQQVERWNREKKS